MAMLTCLRAIHFPISRASRGATTAPSCTKRLQLLLQQVRSSSSSVGNMADNQTEPSTPVATFAAGCFWGVELAFQRVLGVTKTTVGYSNGHKESPTYKEVCTGTTGHAEVIRIEFDENVVKYRELLDLFWSIHDPTTLNRQKGDIGTQYRSAIFFHTVDQEKEAKASLEAHQKLLKNEIVTQIEPAGHFWPAEEYHQQYLEKGGQCADKGNSDKIRCYG